jgi:hypothetical protein
VYDSDEKYHGGGLDFSADEFKVYCDQFDWPILVIHIVDPPEDN